MWYQRRARRAGRLAGWPGCARPRSDSGSGAALWAGGRVRWCVERYAGEVKGKGLTGP